MSAGPSPRVCAARILDAVPAVMQAIRLRARSERPRGVSMVQFRAMGFLGQNGGASLSEVAEFLGLTLTATSRLVDGLATRGLVTREESPEDRRRVALGLTARGRALLRSARRRIEAQIAEVVRPLSAEGRASIVEAMGTLRPLFAPEKAGRGGTGRRGGRSP